MPHQCLQCGELFADGSRDLLKGCSGCGGSKFFFTKEALDAETRSEMAQETETDVRTMLTDLLAKRERPDYDDGIWSRDAWEQWVRGERPGSPGANPAEATETPDIDPSGPTVDADPDAAEAVEVWDVPAEEAPAPDHSVQSTLDTETIDAPKAQPEFDIDLAEKFGAAPENAEPADPQTLRIRQPGQYELDIERLVDKAPVIVEKDGVYMVHLPSVFEAPDAKRGRKRGR